MTKTPWSVNLSVSFNEFKSKKLKVWNKTTTQHGMVEKGLKNIQNFPNSSYQKLHGKINLMRNRVSGTLLCVHVPILLKSYIFFE